MLEFIKMLEKKTIFTIVGVIAIIIVVFVLLNILSTNVFNKKSYSEVRNIMQKAATKYVNDHKNVVADGESVEIDVITLVNNKYMKDINKYTKKKNESCNGEVIVTNSNNYYKYTPMLYCGEGNSDVTIAQYIKDNESVVETGNGLYNLNEKLTFRGDNVNNFIKFDNKNWRIVRIENNKLVLIYNEKLERQVWDDRYNIDKKSNVGINDYTKSRLKDYLEKLYDENKIISEDEKGAIVKYSLPIGKRDTESDDKTGSVESSVLTENRYIGLVTVSDFLYSSLDVNCNSSLNQSCSNYNYLSDYKYNYWTITADNKTTYNVFLISSSGYIVLRRSSSSAYIRPVIYLNENTAYVSGDGTIENPYIVR